MTAPADAAALTALAGTLRGEPGVASVRPFPTAPGAKVGIVQVVPTTSPQDAATSDLVQRLRTSVIPAAEQGTSLRVHVGGTTAIFDDFANVLTSKLPLFLGVIVLLGFLLLMLAFRSGKMMHIFGEANWSLPAWLDRRLPHLSVDQVDDEPLVRTSPH